VSKREKTLQVENKKGAGDKKIFNHGTGRIEESAEGSMPTFKNPKTADNAKKPQMVEREKEPTRTDAAQFG